MISQYTHAGGIDKYTVRRTLFHHLRITGDNINISRFGRVANALEDLVQHIQVKALFENQR